MKQDEIAGKIALYLASEMHARVLPDSTIFIVSKRFESGIDAIKCISAELAAAIAPHLEAGAGWDDAPGWAQWRTVDKTGQVTFWENQPHAHLNSKYWCDDNGGNRKYCEVDGWQYKIQQRPN